MLCIPVNFPAFDTWYWVLLPWGLTTLLLILLAVTGVRVLSLDLDLNGITLSGIHPDFVTAVENARNTEPRGNADCG